MHYCYDTPKDHPTAHVCEVTTTPSGRYTFYLYRNGWDKGVLGALYNPFYFNKGEAVHGYESVPPVPASHGCSRIPMHIAEYFHTLVNQGDPVYVDGGQPAQVLSSTPINGAGAAPRRRRSRAPGRPPRPRRPPRLLRGRTGTGTRTGGHSGDVASAPWRKRRSRPWSGAPRSSKARAGAVTRCTSPTCTRTK